MSCVFCNSAEHFSPNCEIYVSDVAREYIIKTKSYCFYCLNFFDPKHDFFKCKDNQKCYTCFSTGHHPAFCPERFSTAKPFIPKIDKILLQRFSVLFDSLEQLTLAMSSPYDSQKFITPQKFINKASITNSPGCSSMKMLNTQVIVFYEAEFQIYGWPKEVTTSNMTFQNLRKIAIRISKFLTTDLLQLLSSKTKELVCSHSEFSPELPTFSNILEKVPNIEVIDFYRTNVKIEKNWLEDLLKYKNGNNLECVKLSLDDSAFNAETLLTIIKTKSKPNVKFSLSHSSYDKNIRHNFSEQIKHQLSSHFMQTFRLVLDSPSVVIGEHTSEKITMTSINSDD